MTRGTPWLLRASSVALGVATVLLLFAMILGPRLRSAREGRGSVGAAAAIEELRVAATDAAMARLGRLRDGERAVRALTAANDSAARIADDVLRRSAGEIERSLHERSALPVPAPTPGARFLSPVQLLAANAARRENALDVLLSWTPEDPGIPSLRFEVWRWTSAAEPRLVAAELVEPKHVDANLPPGPIEVGYTVFAVTADGSGSRSEGRAVQVELPALHELRLLEEELAERSEPPPAAVGSSEPPASEPALVRLELRRLEDGRSEVVEVRPGEAIGHSCATGMQLVALSWVELARPIRYREPVFRSDGTLEPGPSGAQTKTFVLEEKVWLPAAEVRDGWGRTLQILPPAEVSRTR